MTQNFEKVKKIKGHTFSNSDGVEFDLVFEKIISSSGETLDFSLDDHFPELVQTLYEILTSGQTWEFNPTNAEVRNQDGLDVCRDMLKTYIEEHSYSEIEALGPRQTFIRVQVPVKILVANFRELDDEILTKSESYTVTTLFGDIDL